MQKAVIFLCCLIGLAAAGSRGWERSNWWSQKVQESGKWAGAGEPSVHEKQKFLLDVLWQVQKPVVNRELIQWGKEPITDPAAYQQPIGDILAEFLKHLRQHDVLGRNQIYTDINVEHSFELVGLAKFLTLARDWATFQRNVAFARLHLNPVLFVSALQIAVDEREDTQELVMPAINEILPHLFYDKDVIFAAENADWQDLISKTTTPKPSLTNVLGLNNVWGIIVSPIHWMQGKNWLSNKNQIWQREQEAQQWRNPGKIGLWRPWHERHMSVIAARTGKPFTTFYPFESGVQAEDQQEQNYNLLDQSEEKVVISVENQQTPLSYLTDDVGLNIFWSNVINERVIQTLTGEKHQEHNVRMGVQEPKSWEPQSWKPQSWEPQSWKPQSWEPQSWEPQSWEPQSWVPLSRGQGRWQRILGSKQQGSQVPQWWRQKMTGGRGGQTDEEEEDILALGVQGKQQKGKSGKHWRFTNIRNGRMVSDMDDEEENMKFGGETEMHGSMMGMKHMTHMADMAGQMGMQSNMDENTEGSMQGKDWLSNKNQIWQREQEAQQWRKPWTQHKTPGSIQSTKQGSASWKPKWDKKNIGGSIDNVQHWGRIIENEGEEGLNQQQSGWASGISQQTRWNKQQQQQQPGFGWGRHTTESQDSWMSGRTAEDELQHHLDAINRRNWEQQQWEEAQIMQNQGPSNKWIKQQQKNERNLFSKVQHRHQHEGDDEETNMHSRMTRSIKTVDISPEQELMAARSGEVFVQNIQQLIARINLEKISLANWQEADSNIITTGFNTEEALQLLTTSGAQYQQTVLSPAQTQKKIQQAIQQLESIIDNTLQRSQISQGNPEILQIVGDILVERNNGQENIWNELYNEINSAVYGVNFENAKPTLMSISTGNLRDPVYQDVLTSLNDLIEKYKQQVQPYVPEQLLAPGIHIDNVEVDNFITYFDVTDSDLINLVDQQLLQTNVNNVAKLQKKLVARQQRLNHKQFTLSYDVHSQRPQQVVVRTFLGPKIDENGQIISWEEARPNHILLDAFVDTLEAGSNHIERNSHQITWTTRDTSSLPEIYRSVVQGQSLEQLVGSNCRFPHRLLLPRGTANGLPMQLFVVVTPVAEEDRILQQLVQAEGLCGAGIAGMHLDKLPLNFPLDRQIENVMEFLQPNMIVKDVEIVHEQGVAQLGHF